MESVNQWIVVSGNLFIFATEKTSFLHWRRTENMCTTKECIAKLRENMPYIQKEYGVTGLCLFGSVARGDNRPDSDVDILVDMPPKIFALGALHRYLESLLKTSVDLIRRHSHLSDQFQDQIAREGVKIF